MDTATSLTLKLLRDFCALTEGLEISRCQQPLSKDQSGGSGFLWEHTGCVPALQKGVALYKAGSRWTWSGQFSKGVNAVHPNSSWQAVSLCICQSWRVLQKWLCHCTPSQCWTRWSIRWQAKIWMSTLTYIQASPGLHFQLGVQENASD